MKRVGVLNSLRMVMIFIHLYFTYWILDIWGFKLKTFLFLTKINFFVNFFYFFYTGIIVSYLSYKLNEEAIDSAEYTLKSIRLEEHERFVNSTFKFSFCLSVAVNILYWSLVFFSPNMLGTTATPVLLDVFLHGGNMAVLLIDLIFNKKFNRQHFVSKAFLIKFTIFYFTLQYVVFYTMNIEIYPMVSRLSLPQFSLVGLAGFGLFSIGDIVYESCLSNSVDKLDKDIQKLVKGS